MTMPDPESAARVAAAVARFERRCLEAGTLITGDGRVDETAAAALLGLAAMTLANKRTEASGPPFYRLSAGNGSRVSYSLVDLAEFVERHRAG